MLTFYGYKRCSTSSKAEKFLQQHGIEYQFIDITQNPPNQDKLTTIFELSAQPIRKFFNTSGMVYREMKLKDKLPQMDESEMLTLLSANGKLIKRPLISDGKRSSVGFNETNFQTIWLK